MIIKIAQNFIYLGLIALLVTGCQSIPLDGTLSVKEAIETSKNLDSSEVSITGYLSLEFEDFNLYDTRRAAKNKINNDTECLSLDITQELYDQWKMSSGSLVTVTGILNSDFCGKGLFCNRSCNVIGLEKISIANINN